MLFEKISPAPPDPILGLTEAFKKDPRAGKINLGVGVYLDDSGATPILQSVKQAEKILLELEKTKSYLPITGSQEYARCVQELVLGAQHPLLKQGRVRTAHAPGGTGALRVGAEFLKEFAPGATVWLSAPTWPNHKGVFNSAGFKVQDYPYYHPATRDVAFDRMMETLEKVPSGDIVVLHVCCHNPTGVDLLKNQWETVAQCAIRRGWFPFFDFAYQGFASGLEDDRAGLEPFLNAGLDCFISSSFSKNFGLYQERVGALTLIAADEKSAEAAFSHIKKTVRVIYSNPPAHGGAIVTTILNDPRLRALWEEEVRGMCARIHSVRDALVSKLQARGTQQDFSYIHRQRGMFSFSGLTDAEVQYLRDKKAIYMVGGGRINVAGITSANIDALCDAIHDVLSAGV